MRVEVRTDSVTIDGYVNAVGRDSRPLRDRNGERFVEQIVPGAFKRALERAKNIRILLNHDKNRDLGGTDSNLELKEDAIGLRAITTITDPEVIKDAREGKLRGWSFGFCERKASEEDTSNGMKRRFVEDLDLLEVSLVDQKKVPCYAGTSIECRAEDGEDEVVYTRELETEVVISEERASNTNIDSYKERLKKLGGKANE